MLRKSRIYVLFLLTLSILEIMMWKVDTYAAPIETQESYSVEFWDSHDKRFDDYEGNIKSESKDSDEIIIKQKASDLRLMKDAQDNSDSPKYSGDYRDIVWTIDRYGSLHVTGKGEFKEKNSIPNRANLAPWARYAKEIKSAVVELEDTTDFSQMFWNCENLETVVFKNTKTLQPVTMEGMFMSCYRLRSIIWGSLDTSKVTNMYATFAECESLKSLDLSGFDTSELEQAPCMVWGCASLNDIKFGSKFKISKTKEIYRMFSFCSNLKELNLSTFDCSSIGKGGASKVFDGCDKLQKIISPATMGSEEIELYVDSDVEDLFVWTALGSEDETKYIQRGNDKSPVYIRGCICDYWAKFENGHTDFDRFSDYYYMTENDYERLGSNLTPSEYMNVFGRWGEYVYRDNEDVDGILVDKTLWTGSCHGMSTWASLQNNGWVMTGNELKATSLNLDTMSKINYYHVQQRLRAYIVSKDNFYNLSNETKISMLKSNINSGKYPLIAYSWKDNGGEWSSHAVCGLGIRHVNYDETTDDGQNVSGYEYCAVVYDPNQNSVSTNSSRNIYFNDDGSFYIPSNGIKKELGDNNAYIGMVTTDKNYINRIDYYTGNLSAPVQTYNKRQYFRMNSDRQYNVAYEGAQATIERGGKLVNKDVDIHILAESNEEEDTVAYYTISVPESGKYSISSDEEFDIYMLGEEFTTYSYIGASGTSIIENTGDVRISAEEETKKVVSIARNDRGQLWNYIDIVSDKGSSIEVLEKEDKLIISGDDLTDTEIQLKDNYNGEGCKIKLFKETTKAEITREDEGAVVIQDGINENEENNGNEEIKQEYKIKYTILDNWENGYNATVEIENVSEEVIDNWKISFKFDAEISNIWNAEVLSHDGNNYIIKNVGYNQDIETGNKVIFGFTVQGNTLEEPSEYRLIGQLKECNNDDFSVDFRIVDEWNDGYTANLSIVNETESVIEDWIIEFDTNNEITDIWGGEITEHEGNHYVIKNLPYLGNIDISSSVTIGFNANKETNSDEPVNYRLFSRQ